MITLFVASTLGIVSVLLISAFFSLLGWRV